MKTCVACGKEIGRKNISGFCKICYARDYRKRNKEKIAPVTRVKYFRRRDYFLGKTKEWQQKNKKRYNEYMRKYYHENSEEWIIRQRTQYLYGDLKKESSCELCESEDKLEFHHEKPYDPHVFVILCFKCHRGFHGGMLSKEEVKIIQLLLQERRTLNLNEREVKKDEWNKNNWICDIHN